MHVLRALLGLTASSAASPAAGRPNPVRSMEGSRWRSLGDFIPLPGALYELPLSRNDEVVLVGTESVATRSVSPRRSRRQR